LFIDSLQHELTRGELPLELDMEQALLTNNRHQKSVPTKASDVKPKRQ